MQPGARIIVPDNDSGEWCTAASRVLAAHRPRRRYYRGGRRGNSNHARCGLGPLPGRHIGMWPYSAVKRAAMQHSLAVAGQESELASSSSHPPLWTRLLDGGEPLPADIESEKTSPGLLTGERLSHSSWPTASSRSMRSARSSIVVPGSHVPPVPSPSRTNGRSCPTVLRRGSARSTVVTSADRRTTDASRDFGGGAGSRHEQRRVVTQPPPDGPNHEGLRRGTDWRSASDRRPKPYPSAPAVPDPGRLVHLVARQVHGPALTGSADYGWVRMGNPRSWRRRSNGAGQDMHRPRAPVHPPAGTLGAWLPGAATRWVGDERRSGGRAGRALTGRSDGALGLRGVGGCERVGADDGTRPRRGRERRPHRSRGHRS